MSNISALTPELVENLALKAFVLEATSDKTDCTGRHNDLPGKPLEDFLIAGINSGLYFRKYADECIKGSKVVFKYLVPSLKASNTHKSSKYVNMGLLEVMFVAIAARLSCDDPTEVVNHFNKVLKNAPPSDARALIEVRQEGWRTSKNPHKLKVLENSMLVKAKTPYEFNKILYQNAPKDSASYQWCGEFHNNSPILQQMFQELRQSKEKLLLDKISLVFNPIRYQYKDIKIGILADFCAAAIFLHLSFLEN